MRFANISYVVVNSRFPKYDATGDLPQLRHGKALVSWRRSVRYLRQLSNKKYDLDKALTRDQRADACAYCAMLQTTLHDALLFCQFADQKRFDSHTKPLMKATMVAPLRWFLPSRVRAAKMEYLQEVGMDRPITVRQETLACYRALEAKLGKKPFLFGDAPSSADALLFGHLEAAQHEVLGEWLADFRNLRRFHAAVRQQYFEDATSGVGFLCSQGVNVFEAKERELRDKLRLKGSKKVRLEEEEAQARRDSWWRAGVVATGTFLLALSIGLSRSQGSGKRK